MISNVQLNAATQVNTVNKVSEDITVKPANESESVIANVAENTDKLEISNEAHTASQNTQVVKDFPEVFTVNFWSKGLEE